MLPRAVSDHYRAQQRLIVAALGLSRREWAKMGADFDASWTQVGPRLQLVTASAQLGAARSGASYVPATLAELGQSVPADGEVDPRAFAGWASDGRPLDSLLYGAVVKAKEASRIDVTIDGFQSSVSGGASPAEALAIGGQWLDMVIHTQIADAARAAAGVAIAARPKVGWRRMVNPPCCERCAILAGKWFKWNQGFDRHPRCDCTHIPATEDAPGNIGTDPDALFASGQVRGLKDAERKAIADGADPAAVVNARRGASGMTTTESTTKAGRASRGRLTPDGIYRTAKDRTDALRLLQQHGYLK